MQSKILDRNKIREIGISNLYYGSIASSDYEIIKYIEFEHYNAWSCITEACAQINMTSTTLGAYVCEQEQADVVYFIVSSGNKKSFMMFKDKECEFRFKLAAQSYRELEL